MLMHKSGLLQGCLDRLARSTRDLLNNLDALAKRGATFRSLGDAWANTTTPSDSNDYNGLRIAKDACKSRVGSGRICP
jgi:DNA invertase Pin-like site-specific DNA recombinase